MADKSFKPTLQELALIGWLLDAPEKRFAMFFTTGGLKLYERTVRREEDGLCKIRVILPGKPKPEDADVFARFGGKIRLDEHALRSAGLLVTSKAVTNLNPEEPVRFKEHLSDIWIPGEWSIHGVLATIAPTAADWWEKTGRALYEKQFAKLQAKQAKAAAKERMGIFGVKEEYDLGPYGGIHSLSTGRARMAASIANGIVPKWRGARPAYSATIVRETDTRYYVKDVKWLISSRLRVDGGGRSESWFPKNRLLLDNATEDDVRRLMEFDAEVVADYRAARDKLVEAMVPALEEALDKSDQKAAEIDGTFAELLAALRHDPRKTK